MDGVLGPKTRVAINTIDPESFIFKFTITRIKHYADLVANPRYSPYLRGWINRALEAVGMRMLGVSSIIETVGRIGDVLITTDKKGVS